MFDALVHASGRLFAMNDREQDAPRAVTLEAARALNAAGGVGVFWAPNPFRGRRCLANVTGVEWWTVEMDEGDKAAQLGRLSALPAPPTAVVESRRSLHCYWRAQAPCTVERYDSVVRGCLVPLLGADARAATAAGLYRAPGFAHWKTTEPFPVRTVWHAPLVAYSADSLLRALGGPRVAPRRAGSRLARRAVPGVLGRLEAVDMQVAIERLNGTVLQGGKVYAVGAPRASDGHRQVDLVRPERRKTPIFVVPDGRYFLVGGGGGGVLQWVRYNARKYTPGAPWTQTWAELRRLFAAELGGEEDA